MRRLVLIVFLSLLLLPIANPSMSSIPAAIVDEAFETLFFTAADGDVSSESIGEDYSHKLRETLPDDTLFFSDTFHNDTIVLASSGTAGPSETWDYTHTHYFEEASNRWYYGSGNPDGWTIINFTVPTGDYTIDGFDYAINCVLPADDDSGDFLIYDWTVDDWVDFGDVTIGGFGTWHNGTLYDPDHWDTQISLKVNSTDAGGPAVAYIDYAEVTFYEMHLVDSDHYGESFSSVSDCLIMDDEGDDTFSSDGDLLHFESKTDSENDGESVYSNVPSLVGQYLEIRYRLNTTSLAIFAVGTYSSDGGLAGNINWFGMTITTSWTTSKFPINSDTVIESVRLYIYHVTGQPPVDLQVDYLRIGPSTEMGWQNDGSTTAGWALAYGEGTVSSDGDAVNYTGAYDIMFDAGTTDQYSFVEIKIDSVSSSWQCGVWIGATKYTIQGSCYTSGVFRYNIRASAAGQITGFRMYSAASPAWVEIDYIKAYSIANDTVTQSGVTTDDVLYTDSGVLYSSIDDGYIELNHDPALSVSDTYSVWNLTTSGTAPEFSQYVSEWSAYSDESRGATTSGTITDIKLKFDSIETISAIKFIEDGTAPTVVRSSSTPNDPEDDETVTLSAVITDAVEVYAVAFNAIVYPTGFSDVDYDATEQADNLWTYEFSSLITGYYCFKIIASDGANDNALTEYAYIELSVREAAIRVEEITLIGAGSDFEMMTFSARINRDCSFTIYEESASSAEADTHTGSVTAPSFNLAWTKLDVDDANVNFTIRFTSGSLTYNYTSQYQVASITLQVTDDSIRTTASYAYLTGHVNLNANYTVYEETVQVGTGSVSAGSFEIRWTKASADVENVTVLFESGSQSYPVYSGYDVAAQVTFVVESWWMDLNLGVESYVEFYVLSSFENATVYVYDNNTLMTTVTESAGGAYSYFWMSESEGLHTITLNITHGATVHTRTRTFYIPDWAATGLVVRWDLWTFQDNYTMLELESNWMNCTYYVYLNSSLVATSANDPVTLNFTRAINIGEYNLTIYADGVAQTYTIKNIRYIITEEGVSYDYSSVVGGRSVREGDVYITEGDDVVINENPPGIYMTAETAATIAVSTVFIFFLAVLFMNSRVKKAQLDRDKKETQ